MNPVNNNFLTDKKFIIQNMFTFKNMEKGALYIQKMYLPAQAGGNVIVSYY